MISAMRNRNQSNREADADVFPLEHIEAALLATCRGKQPTGEAAPYAGIGLKEALALCQLRQPNWSMRQLEKLDAAGTTSDFPFLLANVFQKRLLDYYRDARPSARVLTKEVELSSFRVANLMFVDFPMPQLVGEHGEIKFGTLSEGGEILALSTFARITALTRQAVLADDTGSFDGLAQMAGFALAQAENSLFFSVLLANAAMRDGFALFSSQHNNLMSAAALSQASLGLAIAALRSQRSLDSQSLNLTPKYLLVGPSIEITARNLLFNITPASTTPIELLVDSHLTDASWYVWADPTTRPGVVRGTLYGAPPFATSRQGFNVDAYEFLVRHDFAYGPSDWRPVVKNPGQ